MALHRQPDGAVQELDQHAPLAPLAQQFAPVRAEQVGQQLPFPGAGNALVRVAVGAIERMDIGCDPFLGVKSVCRFVAEEAPEQAPAGIDPPDPVPLKKDRSVYQFRLIHTGILPLSVKKRNFFRLFHSKLEPKALQTTFFVI